MLESELFALFDHTAEAAYAVTEQGEIVSWNAAAEQLFGYPAAEVLRHNVADVFEARDELGTEALAGGGEAATRRWDGASGGVPTFDLQVRTRSGSLIWVKISTIVYHNQRTGRRLFMRLVRDETQARRQAEQFSEAVEAARQLVALAGEAGHHAPVSPLSEQECRILKLFAGGSNSTAIARKLGITAQTLRNHLHHINQKLRTRTRLEAVTHAQLRGLLD